MICSRSPGRGARGGAVTVSEPCGPEDLAVALTEALAQPAPDGLVPTFAELRTVTVAARVRPGVASLVVDRRAQAHRLEVIKGEVWGPNELLELPPVRLTLINDDGAVRVRLDVGWSLWSEDGHPEHTWLAHVLRGLVHDGFEMELVQGGFRSLG